MKRIAIFAMIMLFATIVEAVELKVEWGYTPPSAPAVTGFRLYKNKIKIKDWAGGTITSGVVETDIPIEGDSFTLTALFSDATESQESSPFFWRNGPKIIRVSK